MRSAVMSLSLMACLSTTASAQSLLRDEQRAGQPMSPTQPVASASGQASAAPLYAAAPPPESSATASAQPLQDFSLFYVTAPKPKSYVKNDLITILIDEQSTSTTTADADQEKKLNFNASLEHFIDLTQLYGLRLQTSPRSPIAQVDLNANPKWKAQGSYDRADKLAAKITATIIDIKPNGVLVLEAKKTVTKDNEVTTIVLTGNVRTADVTTSNTVLSSQLADLIVSMHNEGDVRDSTNKGWIPRLLDTVFAF
ncbi:MAG: flagellar basal body L-ring protein FlgH [Phycisphaeraceae bacterium]|nr:flagellar basal body L-ring protein FlgH [Phycisphaeraceae bacterium]